MDITQPLRLSIIGAGEITRNAHLPAALKSPRIQLAALVDSDLSRARSMAREFSCDIHVTDRVEEILGCSEGVVIATPNHTHSGIAETVLSAGIPVLIEKPLTTDYASAVRICELAQRHNTFITTGYKTQHYRSVQLLKQLLDRGYFGRIRSFRYEFGSRGGWSPVSGYNLNRQQTGGGVLVVSGTHFLNRMLYWFGEPEIISFQDDSYGGPEANCKAVLRYRNGLGEFEGTILLSKTMPLANQFVMHSERYRCELAEAETEVLMLQSPETPEMTLRAGVRGQNGPLDYFQVQLEDFADSARTGEPPLVDGWQGAACVRLVENLYSSRTQLPEPWMWYGPLQNRDLCLSTK